VGSHDAHDHAWQECLFTDGEFRCPAGGGTIGVRDKASGEIFALAGLATGADVDSAVDTARTAQRAWSERTYAERAGLLRGIAAALAERAGAFRELIMRETGCIAGKADYEISAAASELTEAAGLASRPVGEVLPSGHAGRFSLAERIPVGLVGVITPWNFPLVLGMRVIAPSRRSRPSSSSTARKRPSPSPTTPPTAW
jgi:benzaldehyde dehydrogenase (NAD)